MLDKEFRKLCEDDNAAHGRLAVVKSFADGARVARIFGTLALSRALEAIGHYSVDPETGEKEFYLDEEYDRMRNERDNYALYVLRDPEGRDTLLIEAERQDGGAWRITQARGRGDEYARAAHIPYLHDFIRDGGFDPGEESGLILQDGQYYDARRLPEDFTVEGHLWIPDADEPVALPRGLTVKGYVIAFRLSQPVIVPDDLRAEKVEIYLRPENKPPSPPPPVP